MNVELDHHGFLDRRQLADGRWLCVMPLTFGCARLGITTADFDDGGFVDVWDYPAFRNALIEKALPAPNDLAAIERALKAVQS